MLGFGMPEFIMVAVIVSVVIIFRLLIKARGSSAFVNSLFQYIEE